MREIEKFEFFCRTLVLVHKRGNVAWWLAQSIYGSI